MPNKLLPDTLKVPKHFAITHRESRFLAARIRGLNEHKALREAGFPEWMAHNPERLNTMPQLREILANYESKMAKHTFEEALLDSVEIHEYLTQAVRAKMSDIRNDDGSFKPISEWPDIWQQMAEGGDVDIEYASERSHDGEDKDQAGGWDIKGKILKVKYKFAPKSKLWELAMKHKAINATVQAVPAPILIQDNRIQIQWMDEPQ